MPIAVVGNETEGYSTCYIPQAYHRISVLSDAIKIEPDFEVGEEVNEELRIESFGRRDILALRQNLQTKVSEYEKENMRGSISSMLTPWSGQARRVL